MQCDALMTIKKTVNRVYCGIPDICYYDCESSLMGQCPVSYRGTLSNGREEALQHIIKINEQRYSYAIIFENPGCINNGKQRKILQNADHKETNIDILSNNWTRTSLLPFLVSYNPVELINTTAPRIKSGEIVPSMLSFEETLMSMIESPILKATSIEAEG